MTVQPSVPRELMGGPLNLQIVWRNPQPRPMLKTLVKQIVADVYGGLYAVHNRGELKVFELILRRAA